MRWPKSWRIRIPLPWFFRRKHVQQPDESGRCICSCGYEEAVGLRPGVSCLDRKCPVCKRALLRSRGDAQADLTMIEEWGAFGNALHALGRELGKSGGVVAAAKALATVSRFFDKAVWRALRATWEQESAWKLSRRGRRFRRKMRRALRLKGLTQDNCAR